MDMVPRSFRVVGPGSKALLFLLLLSPAIGELVSGSAPPLEFFNPFVFMFLMALYGCGAVLVRETAVKWKKGWGSIFLLGAAYGIIEEGLAVKSWFDPNWMDLDALGWYGRWGGVNWVWSAWLTIYHMVFSIVIPIMIIDLVFPQLRGRRITTEKQYRNVMIAFIADCLLIFALLTHYFPPVHLLLFGTGLSALLIYLARVAPSPLFGTRNTLPDWSPMRFWALGAVFGFWCFIGFAGGWYLTPIPIVLIMMVCTGCVFVLVMVLEHIGTYRNGKHMVALIAGLMTWMVFIDIVLEAQGIIGMLAVGIGVCVCLYLLWRRAGRMEKVMAIGSIAPQVARFMGAGVIV